MTDLDALAQRITELLRDCDAEAAHIIGNALAAAMAALRSERRHKAA